MSTQTTTPTPKRSRSSSVVPAATVAVLLGIGAAFSGCADAQVPAAPVAAIAPTVQQLGVLAQSAADTGGIGAIVRIHRGTGAPVSLARQVEWTKADHVLAPTDRFRVGSNTKTVTATLVLQQVAEGAIALEDTVESWLPGVVPGGEEITIAQLLDHTSGLADFILTPEFLPSLAGQEIRTWTPEELIAITPVLDPTPSGDPISSYSNANYEALGLVLEEATGMPLDDLIATRITEPLGMTDTYLAHSADWRAGKEHARGYEPAAAQLAAILAPVVELPEGFGFAGDARPDDHVDTTGIDPSYTWAAGAMVSTAEDWQTFLTALNSGQLLPAAQMERMRTVVPDGVGGHYGLGLIEVDSACGTVWGHTGGLPGYSSEIYTDANGERSVAVLTSSNFGIKTEEAAAANRDLVTAAICAMFDEPVPEGSAG
ncbi:beta-lactamase family protein [Clavibacter michiganensis subsp. phaseoli]|uniref:Beta-lactamase family protein n=1 Tax=Clavibacter phaseoli TaxID=1734031 RepID=A0A8I0VAQ2_9MICO|nr:serine hydrolase domain-containing protein [Clavibacter phaseoli]MBF4632748.1 beta-lactamase family protein [Clavibacter phaseoli]